MASRLFAVLDQQGHTLATLNLDGQGALQVGLCSFYLLSPHGLRNVWSAHQHLPGNNCLRGLEGIAILKADDVLRLHWLEAQLRLIQIIRVAANACNILVQQGDENAEKDVRRLEALDLILLHRSLLAGLRHRAGSSNEAIDAIEQALAEDNKKPDYWLQYAQLLHEADEAERALEAVDSCLNLDRQVGDAWALRAKLLSTNQT